VKGLLQIRKHRKGTLVYTDINDWNTVMAVTRVEELDANWKNLEDER
jgi:hypothetical protein